MSRLRMPLLVFCFWAGLLGQSNGSEYFDFYWYNKELDRLVKIHQCEPLSQSQKDHPFYELVTDEIFIGWCSERTISWRHFHLIVLTRKPTHPWASCPKFIRFEDMTGPAHLWMERPTQLRGKTLSLDELVYHEHDPLKPLRPGPKGIKATGPSLWSGDRGGISWFLYCYKGTWLNGGEPD
ncbi:MAG: hypothetical protein U0223_19440 [Nitrospira sp.]